MSVFRWDGDGNLTVRRCGAALAAVARWTEYRPPSQKAQSFLLLLFPVA